MEADRIRKNAYRKLDVGTVFLEIDGPHQVFRREDNADGTYNYHLRKMTPEEVVVLEVLNS